VITFAVCAYFKGVVHEIVVANGIVITTSQYIERPSVPDKIIARDGNSNGALPVDAYGVLFEQVAPDFTVCNIFKQ